MKTLSTRDKLIHAMADALQRKGLHGVSVSEILEHTGLPKGSLYHHFPGGKNQLAVAAIEFISSQLNTFFARLFSQHDHPLNALRHWLNGAVLQLENSQFERGCPLAIIALESSAGDSEIRAALALSFASLRQALASQLQQQHYSSAQAHNLAALFVALYEGGLLQARVAGSNAPLQAAAQALFDLTKPHKPNGTRP